MQNNNKKNKFIKIQNIKYIFYCKYYIIIINITNIIKVTKKLSYGKNIVLKKKKILVLKILKREK